LEGLILPIFVIDNRTWIIDYAKNNTWFKYYAQSSKPTYYLDSGLLILSRFPIISDDINECLLPRDIPHSPGMLSVLVQFPANNMKIRIITCHLLPSVPNTTIPYQITNILNSFYKKDVVQLRARHAEIVRQEVEQYSIKLKIPVILLGDLNIEQHSQEWQIFLKQGQEFGCKNIPLLPDVNGTIPTTVCEKRFPAGTVGAGQIDFILLDEVSFQHSSSSSLVCTREELLLSSDHYAITGKIPLSVFTKE
jgi:endonuclease/exonuclease/phosphatase family metal-dependent hydrolase